MPRCDTIAAALAQMMDLAPLTAVMAVLGTLMIAGVVVCLIWGAIQEIGLARMRAEMIEHEKHMEALRRSVEGLKC